MARRRRATGEFSFRLWLAGAGFLLFSWPIWNDAESSNSLLGFRLSFLAWGLIILAIRLIDRGDRKKAGAAGESRE